MNTPNPSDTPLVAHVKRLWIHGFLVGCGGVLLLLLIWFFIWGWPFASGPEGPEEAKTASGTTAGPAAPLKQVPTSPPPALGPRQPEAALRNQLTAILVKLGEAQQKKDLPLLMSLYAPSFPNLDEKAREIAATWKTYDFPSLKFRIMEIKSQDPENVVATVTWEAETKNRATQAIQTFTKVYLVWFTQDAGRWRIKGLDKTS